MKAYRHFASGPGSSARVPGALPGVPPGRVPGETPGTACEPQALPGPQSASPRASRLTPRACSSRRGSVLVIVMITLLFATFALIAFMEKASVDLLVDQREATTRRLRSEAYSALEMTLGVLEQFREAGNGLRSPAEGWGEPLAFAGYVPPEGQEIGVTFEDESGKISLPQADAVVLTNLFKNWNITQADAEGLADALLGWMKQNHIYVSAVQPNYEASAIPYLEPGRSLRSFQELAAIEKVRETFYDAGGRPNDLWRQFVASVSLFDFAKSNINGASPDALAALGQFSPEQQKAFEEHRRGSGANQAQVPPFFRDTNEAQRVAGPTGNANAFAATISALRITVTVRDGRNTYKVSTVIAPQGGATTVATTATASRKEMSAKAAQKTAQKQTRQNRPNAGQANPRAGSATAKKNTVTDRNLRYPFTLLEIQENEEIPVPPTAAEEGARSE